MSIQHWIRIDPQTGRPVVTHAVSNSRDLRELLERYFDAAGQGEDYTPPEVNAAVGLAQFVGLVKQEQLR